MEAFALSGSREALLTQLDDVSEGAPVICSRGSYEEQELLACSRETGLAPCFILLVRYLTQSKPDFAREAVKAIPDGADTSGVPLEWLKSIWNRIAETVSDPVLEKTANATLDLCNRAWAGDAISSTEWRSVRALFRKIEQEDSRAASTIIAAAAWDPTHTPGAISDAALAWDIYALQRASKALGWTEEHAERQSAYFDAMIKYGEEYAGPRESNDHAWRKTQAGRAWGKQLSEGMAKYKETVKPDFPDINPQLMQARNEAAAEAQNLLLATLTRCAVSGVPCS